MWPPLQDYYEVLGVAKAGRVWGFAGCFALNDGILQKMGKWDEDTTRDRRVGE